MTRLTRKTKPISLEKAKQNARTQAELYSEHVGKITSSPKPVSKVSTLLAKEEEEEFKTYDICAEDPETMLTGMRNSARSRTADLIPRLYEKALNAPAKDSLAIFEALADRSGFEKPTKGQDSNSGTQILNIGTDALKAMLGGLSQITGGSNED